MKKTTTTIKEGKSSFGIYNKSTGSECSLESIKYEYSLQDSLLKKSIIQKFINKKSKPIELLYKFTTNESTTIYSIKIDIYDPITNERKKLLAKVNKKEIVQEQYDDAIADGNSAMIAEEDEDDKNMVSLSLGNIQKKNEVLIMMECVEEIECEKDYGKMVKYQVFIPSMNYSGKVDDQIVKNVEVKLNVNMTSGEIKKIYSSSHENLFSVENDSTVGKLQSVGKLSYSKDIEIYIEVENPPLINVICEQRDDEVAAMVSIIPSISESDIDKLICSELVFIVDCSGSMSGSRMRKAKEAMRTFIDNLNLQHKLRINIVRFGSSNRSLYDSPQDFDYTTKQEAYDYIEETNSNMGGTDIFSAIKNTLKNVVKIGYSRQLFLITDGEDRNTEKIIKFVRKHSKTTRIFTFGIGNEINPVLINQVAKASNGRAVFYKTSGEGVKTIAEIVLEQLKYSLQPSLTNIDVQFVGCTKSKKAIECPPCFNLQKQSLYYLLDKVPDYVVVDYTLGINQKNTSVDPSVVTSPIGALAARKRVLELEKYVEGKAKEKEIEELGMKYHFLTSKTSFIMVSENKDKIEEETVLEVVESIQRKEKKKKKPQRSAYSPPSRNYSYQSSAPKSYSSSYSAPRRRRRRGFQLPSFSLGGGGCFSKTSLVKLKDGTQKMLYEVVCEDFVESFDEKGEIVFSRVVHIWEEKVKKTVLTIKMMDDMKLTLTPNHYIYYSPCYSNKFNDFKMIEADKLEVNGWIMIKFDDNQNSFKPIQIQIIEKSKDSVRNVYTENGNIIIDNVFASILTATTWKSIYYSTIYFKGYYYDWIKKDYRSKTLENLAEHVYKKLMIFG